MVTGWRRPFCTSIPKERENETIPPSVSTKDNHKQQKQQNYSSSSSSNQSPRFSSKFGFLSNPSTPRLQTQPVSIPITLHCKTTSSSSSSASSSLFSNSSSLKTSLRVSKNRCGICLQSGFQGTAIFTAECSHNFHFHCLANQNKMNHQLLTCPVCNSHLKQVPVLSTATKSFKIYNDDEPLGSPISLSHFNPIPESDEDEEFQGFFVTASTKSILEISLLPDSALVAAGRRYETYAMLFKVRAPPNAPARGFRRAPVDLVTVVDLSLSMGGPKLQIIKRAMRLVISSLSCYDRLSIVGFSNASKRLLPLSRMTTNGQRSARRIVNALGITGQGMSANDALKKAVKVLEDRRERNSFACIVILSVSNSKNEGCSSPVVSSTRFSDSDIPVHSVAFNVNSACNYAPHDEAFVKCVGGLLSVVAQDLKLQLEFVPGSAPAEIAAVYSVTGRVSDLGSGSIRLGDLYAEEERDLLIELKVPAYSVGAHRLLSVQSSYKDPSSQELICCKEQAMLAPRPQAVRSSTCSIEQLRNLHISTRAVAESRKLMELDDLSGAYHLLSSARALLVQRGSNSADEFFRGLDGDLAEMHWRRQQVQSQRQRVSGQAEEKLELLTPTSAWRAAERLAKVAIMRKHMNKVGDLHGFENARF